MLQLVSVLHVQVQIIHQKSQKNTCCSYQIHIFLFTHGQTSPQWPSHFCRSNVAPRVVRFLPGCWSWWQFFQLTTIMFKYVQNMSECYKLYISIIKTMTTQFNTCYICYLMIVVLFFIFLFFLSLLLLLFGPATSKWTASSFSALRFVMDPRVACCNAGQSTSFLQSWNSHSESSKYNSPNIQNSQNSPNWCPNHG